MRIAVLLAFALLLTACAAAKANPPSLTQTATRTMTASPVLALLTAAPTSPTGATPTQPPISGPAACQVVGHGTSGLVDAIVDASLAQAYAIDSTVVVARVTGVLRPLRAEDPLLSVYSAAVADSVTGELRTGDTFAVWQNGGLSDGQVHEQPEDPMIRVGCTYLFMLEPQYGFDDIGLPEPWGQTWGFPMSGRFNVGDDGRLAVTADYWSEGHPATDLVGLTVDEAKARIQQVATEVTPVPRATPSP